jgi:arginyl-tRNA synthetase
LKADIEQLLRAALAALAQDGTVQDPATAINITRSKDPEHGDFACNVALTLAKAAGLPPRKLAEMIVARLPANTLLLKCEIAGPGFINFFVSRSAGEHVVARILQQQTAYGRSAQPNATDVLIEFVSANPTGPLHVGHGRQAALGDALAAVLESQGYKVSREFYYNDAGVQIENLALSVQSRARGLKPTITANIFRISPTIFWRKRLCKRWMGYPSPLTAKSMISTPFANSPLLICAMSRTSICRSSA